MTLQFSYWTLCSVPDPLPQALTPQFSFWSFSAARPVTDLSVKLLTIQLRYLPISSGTDPSIHHPSLHISYLPINSASDSSAENQFSFCPFSRESIQLLTTQFSFWPFSSTTDPQDEFLSLEIRHWAPDLLISLQLSYWPKRYGVDDINDHAL